MPLPEGVQGKDARGYGTLLRRPLWILSNQRHSRLLPGGIGMWPSGWYDGAVVIRLDGMMRQRYGGMQASGITRTTSDLIP